MRRGAAKKKLLVAMAAFALLVLLLVALTPTMLNLGLARGRIERAAAASLNGHVRIGELGLSWFGAQSARDVTVTDAAGDRVADLDIALPQSLFALLTGGLSSPEVEISGEAEATLDESGRLDLLSLLKAPDPNEPSALADLESLRLDVRDATLVLHDRKAGRTLTINDLEGSTTYLAGQPLKLELTGATTADDVAGSLSATVSIDRFLDAAGRFDVPGAGLDAEIEIASVPVPMVPDGGVIERLRLTAKSDRIRERVDATIDGAAALASRAPSAIEGRLTLSDLYTPAGEPSAGLDGITGRLSGTGVPTSLVQPFLAGTAFDAMRDLGPTADISAEFSEGTQKTISLSITSPRADFAFAGAVDADTRAVQGERLTLDAEVQPPLAAALAKLQIDRPAPVHVELTSFSIPPRAPDGGLPLRDVALTGSLRIAPTAPIVISVPKSNARPVSLASLHANLESASLDKGLTLTGDAAGDFGTLTIDERLTNIFDANGDVQLAGITPTGTTTLDALPGSMLAGYIPDETGVVESLLDEPCRITVASEALDAGLRVALDFQAPGLVAATRFVQRPDGLALEKGEAQVRITPEIARLAQGDATEPVTLRAPTTATVELQPQAFPGSGWTDYAFLTTPIIADLTLNEAVIDTAPRLAESVRIRDATTRLTTTLAGRSWRTRGGLSIERVSTPQPISRVEFDIDVAATGGAESATWRPTGTAQLTQIALAPLEAALGRSPGDLSRWLGGEGNLAVTLSRPNGDIAATVEPEFERFAGTFAVGADREAIVVTGSSSRFILAGELLGAAPGASPPVDTFALAEDVPLQLNLDALRLPRPMLAGGTFDPADFDLSARLTGGPVHVVTKGETVTLRDLVASIVGEDLSKSLDFALSANPDTDRPPSAEQVRGIQIAGSISSLLDDAGRVAPAGAHVQLDAGVEHFPTALADALFNQQGLLVAAVGPSMKASFQADDFSRDSGTLDARLDTDHGWLEAHVLGRDGTAQTAPDTPLRAELEVSRPLREKLLYKLGPFLADIRSAESPVDFTVSNATFPLDGDVRRLNADIEVVIGAVEYDSGSTTLGIFNAFNVARGPTVPGMIEPIRATIRNGLVTYEQFSIHIDKYTLPFSGTIDLVNGLVELRTQAPMTGLALTFKELRAAADLQVPILIHGPFGRLKTEVDPNFNLVQALIEQGLVDNVEGLGNILDPGGLLDTIFGGGKKDERPSGGRTGGGR